MTSYLWRQCFISDRQWIFNCDWDTVRFVIIKFLSVPMKQNQTHSCLVKLTASASTLRYKAVNRTEGLTLGFAERWRIQPRWRSFDRQPLSSMPHCHHTGRQSERLPWSTVSLQIYHFKSPLSPWPASHLSAPTNTLPSPWNFCVL